MTECLVLNTGKHETHHHPGQRHRACNAVYNQFDHPMQFLLNAVINLKEDGDQSDSLPLP
jgi:hypothetical protein